MSIHLANIRKQYANFTPMLINSDTTRSSLKQQTFTTAIFNPESFISQQLIPAADLPALLPTGYRPLASEHLNCAICGHAAVDPLFFKCGCVVCCLCDAQPDSYCKAHSEPFGLPIQPTEEQKGYLQEKILCPFEAGGCNETISLQEFSIHINRCRFSAVRCPYCKTPGFRNTFDEHYAICPSLPCKCALCGEDVQISLIGQHVEEMHPICGYCHERKVDERQHKIRQCFVPGCAEVIAECILKQHLKDSNYADLHCEELVERCYASETQLSKMLSKEKEQSDQILQLQQQIVDIQSLRLQLRDVTMERDRIKILNSEESPSLELISEILTVKERISVAYQLLQFVVDKPESILLSTNIRFDKQLKMTIKVVPDIPEEMAKIEANQRGITSFVKIMQKELRFKQTLNDTENAVQSIFDQIIEVFQQYKGVQRVQKLILICFCTAFSDYIYDLESINVELLQYCAGQLQGRELLVLLQSAQLSYKVDDFTINEYVQLARLPIIKFTASSNQQYIFNIQQDQNLQQYDYVFQGQAVHPLLCRVFTAQLRFVQQMAAPRVLAIGSPDNYTELMPEHCFSLSVQLEKTPDKTIEIQQVAGKIAQSLQELTITAAVYDTQCEIIHPQLFISLEQAQSLTYLQLEKLRIAGQAAEALEKLQNCQGLRFLLLRDCEICHPSQLKTNFPALFQLQAQLHSLDSRKRLFEADGGLFCQQLSNLQLLEQLNLDFSSDFLLNVKAATALGVSLSQCQRLQKCEIWQCGLRGEALIMLLKNLQGAPRLKSLSLQRNPIFAADIEAVATSLMELLQMTQLTELDLTDTRLNAKALQEMANCRQQLGLQMLKLDKNRLTDEDCKNLARLMIRTPALSELSVRHCRDISTRGVRILVGRTGRAFRISYENSQKIEEEMADMRFSYIDGIYVKTE